MLPCVDVFVVDEFSVWAPILLARLALRLGAHLANVHCVALGRPTCGRALRLRWGTQLADVPCFALGRPTCGRALRYVWAPILRMCLSLRWGAQPW